MTGLGPYARMSLLNPRGRKIATERADSLGGLLFRNVTPGSGYSVRLDPRGPKSGPLSVLTTRPAPPSSNVYNQTIKPSGYQYLATRDGIKLAIYVHPPQDVASALPTGLKAPSNPTGGPSRMPPAR